MFMEPVNEMTDDELYSAIEQAQAGLRRRNAENHAKIQAEAMAKQYMEDIGLEDRGTEWVQPNGAFDAYPLDFIVNHNGTEWKNLTPANVWEPGVSGWREVYTISATGNPASAFPDWVQPTGAHDTYIKGETVALNSSIYESLSESNAHSPEVAPQLWTEIPPGDNNLYHEMWEDVAYVIGDRVTWGGQVWEALTDPLEEPYTESEEWKVVTTGYVPPEESTDPPTDPEEPAAEEWVQPTGAHDAYNIGDVVLFEGSEYESLFDANTYSPTAYPAGWNQLT